MAGKFQSDLRLPIARPERETCRLGKGLWGDWAFFSPPSEVALGLGRPPAAPSGGEFEPGVALHTPHRTPLVGRLGSPGAGGCLPNMHGVGG